MSIRSRTSVLNNIFFVNTESNGKKYPRYCASIGSLGGRRIRISTATLAECKRRVNDWYNVRESAGDAIGHLTPAQLSDAILALSELAKANIDDSLYNIVRFYISQRTSELNRVTIQEAYDKFIARYAATQVTTLNIIRTRLGKFVAQHVGKKVDEITRADAMKYLARFESQSAVSWNGVFSYLNVFFNWCAKKPQRFCLENPLAGTERKRVESKLPECASVESVRKLFAYLLADKSKHRDLMLFRFTLSFFCGMRSAEIDRLDVDDVRLDDGSILVRAPKGYQSGRISYRTFRIPPTAAAWFREVDFDRIRCERLDKGTTYDLMTICREACGGKFPKNSGRHSFISYHVAAYGNPHETEGIVGTSAQMRKSHYQTLMTKADGDAFFAITPSAIASAPSETSAEK